MIVSPCTGKCTRDPSTAICKGCGRTTEEIEDWYGLTDDDRMRIMKRLGYGRRISREERLRRYDKG